LAGRGLKWVEHHQQFGGSSTPVERESMITLIRFFATIAIAFILACTGCTKSPPHVTDAAPISSGTQNKGPTAMQLHYLEIVTKDVDAVCAAYAATMGVQFGTPDAGLGNARTAPMPGGGMVGVRAPLRETEEPIVRPYWLVEDIEAALAAAAKAGAVIALPPMKLPGHGTCAICIQGGINHGYWQK
jgi:uncharacterized protein